MSDCLFCRIVKGEIPSKKVHEDEAIFAFEDVAPRAPVHILVVPKKHVAGAAEAGDDPGLFGATMAGAARLAKERGIGDYRLVVNNGPGAGQSVSHLHVHLLAGRSFTWPPG